MTWTTTTTTTTTTTSHHNSIIFIVYEQHHITSYNIILINICIHIVIHQCVHSYNNSSIKVIHDKQSHWKLTILPKTFIYTPKANPKQKRVKITQEHEKVHCYWVIRFAGWLMRRGELAHASWRASGEQTPHYSSPWRADGEQTLLSVTLQFAVASKITRRGELWQTFVEKNDFSPQKPNFHPPQSQIW